MLSFKSYLLFFSAILFFSCKTTQQFSDKNSRPNIIYIYADDLGYGELGSYGQTKIKTPFLDRLAKEGMRFTNHYSSSPVCAPSRASLITGLHQGHAAIRANKEFGGFEDSTERGQTPLPAGSFTLGNLMKNAGYITAVIGKWGMGMATGEGDPNKHGFDYAYGYLDQKQGHNFYPTHLWENGRWDSLHQPFIYVHKGIDSATATSADFDKYKGPVYSQDKFTEKALQFIDQNRKKPFFLYLPYTVPHLSLQVPDKYVHPYLGQFDESPYYGQFGYSPHQYPKSAYAAMVTYLDEQVGVILNRLKQLGFEDNTIVMFSSDNGSTFHRSVDLDYFKLTGDLRGAKMDLYEGGIRVPFIVKWPGKIRQGSVSNLRSVQYDLMATLAEITGESIPDTDGISLLPEMQGKPQRQHDFLYFEFSEKSGEIAVIIDHWKGIRSNLKKDKNAPWQLYDLDRDPSEKIDIAGSHPQILKQMDEVVKRERKPSNVKEWEVY